MSIPEVVFHQKIIMQLLLLKHYLPSHESMKFMPFEKQKAPVMFDNDGDGENIDKLREDLEPFVRSIIFVSK